MRKSRRKSMRKSRRKKSVRKKSRRKKSQRKSRVKKSQRRKSARRKSRRKKSRKRKSRKRKFNVRRKAPTEGGRSTRLLDRSAKLKNKLFETLHKDIGEAEKLKEIKGIMWPIEYKKEDPTRVDVNTKDEEDGDTALIMASYKGHLEIVKYLVRNRCEC